MCEESEKQEALKLLREYRMELTRQQVRTLAGQIRSGQPDAAMNGLARILNRNANLEQKNRG